MREGGRGEVVRREGVRGRHRRKEERARGEWDGREGKEQREDRKKEVYNRSKDTCVELSLGKIKGGLIK